MRVPLSLLIGLLAAPLLPGVINRVKSFFAGRKGQPILQVYRDIWKLLGKGWVYSTSTTWLVMAGPIVGLAAMAGALVLLPVGGIPAGVAFSGDVVLFAGLLALGRFMTILAALDTGSAFEGMGASREAWFSVLTEPTLLLGLAGIAAFTGTFSLSEMFGPERMPLILGPAGLSAGPSAILIAAALLLVFLAENSRIPFDDPNTHLELTMVHEVMVLDHAGPDLALIEYAASLKLWILGSVLVDIVLPIRTDLRIANVVIAVAGLFAVAIITGIVESVMARLKLVRVPQTLVMAAIFAVLALIIIVE